MAIPVMVVPSEELAKDLMILTCKKSYDEERFIINPESGFMRGEVTTLLDATRYLERNLSLIMNRSKINE
jgi:hypothetical protein